MNNNLFLLESTEIQKIEEKIFEAINNNKLILFVGAGASSLSGLPLWKNLAFDLAESCCEKGYINEAEKDVIIKIGDSKQIISIVFENYRENKDIRAFYQQLSKLLSKKRKPQKDGAEIFKFCKKTNALVLTTNADRLLDKDYQNSLIFSDIEKISDWPRKSRPALVKLHGTISDYESLVFTTEQYLRRYSNDDYADYLQDIFQNDNTVLFIGYGMGEFELLEHMLSKLNVRNKGNTFFNNIFVLDGFFSHETFLQKNKERYYRSLGIQLIPYSKDDYGYKCVARVLSYWLEKFEKETNLRLQRLFGIDAYLKKKDVDSIVQIALNNLDDEAYLFSRIRTEYDELEWLKLLLHTDLFDVNKHITRYNSSDGTIQPWYALEFLDYVIEKHIGDPITQSKDIATLLEKIISTVLNKDEKAFYSYINLVLLILSKLPDTVDVDLFNRCVKFVYEKNNFVFGMFVNEVASNVDNYETWSLEKKNVIFNLVIDNEIHDCINHESDDCFKKYYKTIGVLFAKTESRSCLKGCLHFIEEVEAGRPLAFGYIGAFATTSSNSNYSVKCFPYIAEMIKMAMLSSLEATSNVLFVDKRFGSSLVSKIRAYALSVHYEELKSTILFSESNPFDCYEMLGDLYYAIESNLDSVTKEEANLICQRIKTGVFSDINQAKTRAYQYDFLMMIGKKYPEFISIANQYIDEDYDRFEDIYNRNKMYYSLPIDKTGEEAIKNKIKGKSLLDIIDILESEKQNIFNDYDANDAFCFEVASRKELLEEIVEKYDVIPVCYLESILYGATKQLREVDILSLQKLINKVFDYYIADNVTDDLMRANLYALEKLFEQDLISKEDILKEIVWLTKVLTLFISKENICVEDSGDIITAILNMWDCVAITLLLRLQASITDVGEIENTLNLVENIIEKKSIPNRCRATVSYNLSYLIKIDRKYAYSKLDSIFCDENSIAACLVHNQIDYKIYSKMIKLCDVNRLQDVDQELSQATSSMLTRWSVWFAIKKKHSLDDFFDRLLSVRGERTMLDAFKIVAPLLKSEDDRLFANAVLMELCEKQGGYIGEKFTSDQEMRALCSCMNNMDVIDDSVWKKLINLAIYFSSYASDELVECLNVKFDSYPVEVAETVVAILENAASWFFRDKTELEDVIFRIRKDISLDRYSKRIENEFIKRHNYSLFEG